MLLEHLKNEKNATPKLVGAYNLKTVLLKEVSESLRAE